VIADHIARDVCAPVCHRQFVFTVPKRLRIFFRFDRGLLGELPRLAWQTVLEVYRAVLDRSDVTPGMMAAIHTFGQVLHFHPHLHALVSDGAFSPDGTFIPVPQLDGEPFEKLWQRKVFDLLRKRGKISESLVTQMTSWRHSGFSVHLGAKIDADDVAGRERLAQYMLRCPFSLERMIRVTDQGTVLYLAEKNTPQRFPHPATADLFGGSPGVARNFQVFDPLDFIAEITQHIPEARRHLVRYFGFYSSKTRGLRAKADGAQNNTVEIDDNHTPRPHLARRRWAALLKQVWQVDPLVCPRCGHRLQIVSFIGPTQRNVIEKILTRCGLSSRAPPSDARAPPAAPPIRELTYVSDLEFVGDPGPAQPVWSAD
jgi:hypothetical protein